jgi:hypothetical protein
MHTMPGGQMTGEAEHRFNLCTDEVLMAEEECARIAAQL